MGCHGCYFEYHCKYLLTPTMATPCSAIVKRSTNGRFKVVWVDEHDE